MGTHPIFESDFDCLTDCESLFLGIMNKAAEQESTKARNEEVEKKVTLVADDDDDEDEEEELVDPMEHLRGACSKGSHAVALMDELNKCTERVESRSMTEETCTQELFDFIGHRDQCVAKHLFSHIKN